MQCGQGYVQYSCECAHAVYPTELLFVLRYTQIYRLVIKKSSRTWNSSEPTCQGKYFILHATINFVTDKGDMALL